ncbi:MAG: hypothetical protein IT230_11480 [Flavobacteriales bacterium]|nr:hypothetical protein [Flavobacteriales bacterium]
MAKVDRFRNLAEFRAEQQRWADVANVHAGHLQSHWLLLKDPGLRNRLARETVVALVRGALPQTVAGTLSGAGLGGALQWAMGNGTGGWAKRALLFGASLAAPMLAAKAEQFPLRLLLGEVGISLGRLKAYLRDR